MQVSTSIDATDNLVRGVGFFAVTMYGTTHIVFANNSCQHDVPPALAGTPGITITLSAASQSVVGNRVSAQKGVTSFSINGQHLSAVANVTSGQWTVGVPAANVVPTPLNQFNIFGV